MFFQAARFGFPSEEGLPICWSDPKAGTLSKPGVIVHAAIKDLSWQRFAPHASTG